MKIRLVDGLPYVSVNLLFQEQTLTLHKVVIDTGAATTLFRTEDLQQIGITYAMDDIVEQVRGVGGVETVVVKQLDLLQVGDLQLANFPVDMGAMAYGFDIDGLLGFDFLQQTSALIDLDAMEVRAKR